MWSTRTTSGCSTSSRAAPTASSPSSTTRSHCAPRLRVRLLAFLLSLALASSLPPSRSRLHSFACSLLVVAILPPPSPLCSAAALSLCILRGVLTLRLARP
eukprot:3753497-Rhodomonas_salina.2